MANTVFRSVLPELKAIDNGDGTYSISVELVAVPGGGTDTVFKNVDPPLKAIDLGDGTYAISMAYIGV